MTRRPALILGLIAALTSQADAQNYVYPARGQSPAQQKTDESQCYTWAVQQSGVDPARPQPVATAPTTPTGVTPGAGVRGAARGAAGGAAIGAIAGDAGKGAAIGAVSGAMIRRSRSRRANAAQAQAAQQQPLAEFARARTACLEGRGYTVK